MANNTVDMKYVIDSTPIVQASKRLDTMARSLEGLIKKEKSGAITTEQFAKAKKELRRTVDDLFPHWTKAKVAVEGFEKSVKANAKALEVEKAALVKTKKEIADYARMRRGADADNKSFDQSVKREAANLERLRQKYDQGHVAMGIYTKELNDLAMARKRNVITVEEQKAAIERLNVATKNGTIVSAEYGNTLGRQVKKTSRFGVMSQQAGYQVGDFAVQVQSGQNIMVAFGQQATQLVGTMSMLAKTTKMITLFAGLGMVLPILTGVAAALMRTSEAADDTAESVGKLESKLKSLKSTLEDYSNTMKALREGVSLEELFATEGVDEAVAKLKEAEAAVGLAIKKQLASMTLIGRGSARAVTRAEEERLLAVKAVIAARTQLKLLLDKEADTRAENFAEASSQMQHELELLRAIEKYGKGSDQSKKAELEQELRLRLAAIDARVASGELGRNEGEVLKNQVKAAAALGRQIETNTKRQTEYQKTINGLLSQNEVFVNSLNEAAIVAEDKARKQVEYITKLEEKYGESVVTALALAGVDIASPLKGAVLEAANLAKELGVALEVAAELALARRSLGQTPMYKYGSRSSANKSKGFTLWKQGRDKPETDNETPSGGGGKSDAEKMQEKLAKLQEQLAVERELIGASESRVKLVRALGSEFVKNNPEIVAGLEEQINKNLELIQVEKDRQSILDKVKSSMSEGFMSMVEGTKSVKDAFKDMARDIIKQLYEVLVVKRLVGSVGEGGAAGTGIMGILQGLKIFDGGGYTGSGPRSGGMDGRGGYLAMLHPRETVVDHTKAGSTGGGEGVTVVQNFSFQANGDDSVKKIIAQAAPSIANMAKQSVMDSRRRCGSMKNTFG